MQQPPNTLSPFPDPKRQDGIGLTPPWVRAAQAYDAALGREAPELSDELRAEADQAVAGSIHYEGGQFVAIGRSGIDWTGSHIANHVWKERPKRFLYLVPLMTAYRATGAEAYAEAARDYLADWMRAHPAATDWRMPSYDNGLNLAVRVAFFAEALAVFAGSPAWGAAFSDRVVADIESELGFLVGNLSPRGNFRMKQAMTLIECGLRLSERDAAASWRRLGVVVMNDAARRQVLPDGAHVECTAGYHRWMTLLLGDCLKLQRAWPRLEFTFDARLVAGMHDYAVACTRPNGSFCGLHDSEGAWEGRHENIAQSARAAFRKEQALDDTPPTLHQAFPSAGQAFLRDGWGEDATYVTFDATRWGGAHCHLSRNAITVHAHGRSLLLDPGRMSYEMRDPLGPYGKSTRAHNTCNLNGWNQFTTNPDDFRTFHAPGYDCATSRYTGGYWPGAFGWWFSEGLGGGLAATHARHLFWVHGRVLVVIDELTRWRESGRGALHEEPRLETNWQFAPGIVEVDNELRRAWTRNVDSNLLLIAAKAPANARLTLHEGERGPERGWVRDFGRFAGCPAPQLCVAAEPWQGFMETLVTVLVPFRGTSVPEVAAEVVEGQVVRGEPTRLELRWGDGTRETLLWTPGLESMLGRVPDGETDGVLWYRRAGGGREDAVAAVDATGGRPDAVLLSAPPARGAARSQANPLENSR